jgi:hypothetical protein
VLGLNEFTNLVPKSPYMMKSSLQLDTETSVDNATLTTREGTWLCGARSAARPTPRNPTKFSALVPYLQWAMSAKIGAASHRTLRFTMCWPRIYSRSRKSKKRTSKRFKDDEEIEAKLSAILLHMYHKRVQPIKCQRTF